VEIGRAYGIHHTIISKWKRQLVEHGAEVFSGNEEAERYKKRIAKLKRLISQKKVELALLKTSGRELRVEEKMEVVLCSSKAVNK
jgi:transposase-like protein